MEKFSKNGGSWMYVLLVSQQYTSPTEEGISFHAGFCAAKSLYNARKISGLSALFIASRISRIVGHKSRKYTSRPVLSLAMGSVVRSMSTRPASANATTSGGDIRKLALTLEWTRASKLRLPLSTLAATRSFLTTASSIGAGSGPELPMQVVQP